MPRAAAQRSETLDPGIVRLIEALAREAARRDHAAAQGGYPTDASCDLRPVLNRSAERPLRR
jgi:hypothetical protein